MSESEIIPVLKAKQLCVELLTAVGVPSKDADIVANGLVYASLRGIDSHGIRLIAHYTRAIQTGRINPKPKIVFSGTKRAVKRCDAHDGLGIIAGWNAMNTCIELAKQYGVGIVSVAHSSHFGAAGFYTSFAAEKGMIGQAMTHVEALALPHNGTKPFLGTNAFSISAPIAGETPVILDMATTDISFNKLKMYKAQGKALEGYYAADNKGNPTNDIVKAESLLHFGGYKGYGVAYFVDVFSSMLSGMPFGPHIHPMYPLDNQKRKLGQFFMAIDISAFVSLPTFKKRMKQMATELRAIPPRKGSPSVMIPGDPEKVSVQERMKKGIPIVQSDWEMILQVAKDLHVEAGAFV